MSGRLLQVAAISCSAAMGATAGCLTGAPKPVPASRPGPAVNAQVADIIAVPPSVVWRLTKTADRAVVHPGQRITYTIVVKQVQNPEAVAKRWCAPVTNRPACEEVNALSLSQPMIIDDLASVTQHAAFDHDATSGPGTELALAQHAGHTFLSAELDPKDMSATQIRFTFSVTVNRGARPGTAISNSAYVSLHVTHVAPGGPLSNCPVDLLFGAVPGMPPAGLPACTATSIIPPAAGGAHTGFGGMAGHVGNIWPTDRNRHRSSSGHALAHPWQLRIPAIHVAASIVPTGVNRDGTIAVPPLREARAVGWYRFGAVPGSPGPAILLGHVDTYTGPGVFYRLYRLSRGDRIYLRTGRTLTFSVTSLREVPKTEFPEGLYAPAGSPMLYLITCAGTFDHGTHHYQDNIIIGARLLRSAS